MEGKDSFGSLFSDINKSYENTSDTQEGIVSDLFEELSLDISDEDLLTLKGQWEKDYAQYQTIVDLDRRQAINEGYWLGLQSIMNNQTHRGTLGLGTSANMRIQANTQLVDNVIFEAFETLLPIATRENPEPTVFIDDTDLGMETAQKVRGMLSYLADTRSLKIKIKDATRHWGLYYLGVLKAGWDAIENEIDVTVIRPQKLILDPSGTIEAGRFTGEYIGEYKTDTAEVLIKRFPKQAEFIKGKVQKKMGTKLQYMEWWTDLYVFWTMENQVLGKIRNPHWNYSEKEEKTDEYGEVTEVENVGRNHFYVPQKPYCFLSVFGIGRQPHDETTLIEQSRIMQDMVDRRVTQLDRNIEAMNGGLVFGASVSKEAATQATEALRKGSAIRLDVEDIRSAYARDQAPPLPNQVFENLIDARNQILNRFGVRGSTAQGIISERTVRGKYEIKGQDVDRIGLIVEYIEQMADYLFNWWLQMMFVYYNEPHAGSVIGEARAREFFQVAKTDFENMRIIVSVKEGSMLPKDEMNRRNEAIDLWNAGAIDPITLFDRLEWGDPTDNAEKLIAWKTDPRSLLQAQEMGVLPEVGAPQLPTSPTGPIPQQNQSNPPLPPLPIV